jgi:hypothetical protein
MRANVSLQGQMVEYHVQKPEYDAPTSAHMKAAKTDTLTVKLGKRNIAITTRSDK